MSRPFKIAIGFVVAAALWLFTAPYVAERLIIERPLERADAILVLGGSAVYIERTQKAAEVYKRGVAPKILLTDDGERAGWSKKEQTNLPYVELARRALLAQGVPGEAIEILPGQVTGTDWEARRFVEDLDRTGTRSVLLVTSAYHSRRALWTFEKFLAGRDVSIGVEHSPTGEQTPPPGRWWLSARGWNMVGGEYVKSIAYWVYY
jgi:uncharacterized SAM-binding protein YcdF (DUF218 family)